MHTSPSRSTTDSNKTNSAQCFKSSSPLIHRPSAASNRSTQPAAARRRRPAVARQAPYACARSDRKRGQCIKPRQLGAKHGSTQNEGLGAMRVTGNRPRSETPCVYEWEMHRQRVPEASHSGHLQAQPPVVLTHFRWIASRGQHRGTKMVPTEGLEPPTY